eukprot:GHRR01021206.1.p1 GENE.GHRR01021206.1~~GHRR01021206.1.p1  ORF type:complete len:236 (+),score=83.53 GHRR01021206.1:192-899(+)
MIGAAVRTGLPCPAHCRAPMQTRNYFTALVGLSLDDTPASSPTAIAAASRVAARSSSGKGSTTTTTVAAPAAADAATAAVAANGDSSLKPKPNRPKLADPLIWIDLEMTGLDIDKDTIIEIACIVTDGSLQQVIEGPSIAIHHPDSVLDNMNDWCKEHHVKSGLVQQVRDSSISLQQAEQQVLEFIQQHTEYKTAQLAGNSVHVDRLFLQRHMPQLLEHLHYRIVDVSTFKECCR